MLREDKHSTHSFDKQDLVKHLYLQLRRHVLLMTIYDQFQMWLPAEMLLKNYFLWIWSPFLNLTPQRDFHVFQKFITSLLNTDWWLRMLTRERVHRFDEKKVKQLLRILALEYLSFEARLGNKAWDNSLCFANFCHQTPFILHARTVQIDSSVLQPASQRGLNRHHWQLLKTLMILERWIPSIYFGWEQHPKGQQTPAKREYFCSQRKPTAEADESLATEKGAWLQGRPLFKTENTSKWNYWFFRSSWFN